MTNPFQRLTPERHDIVVNDRDRQAVASGAAPIHALNPLVERSTLCEVEKELPNGRILFHRDRTKVTCKTCLEWIHA